MIIAGDILYGIWGKSGLVTSDTLVKCPECGEILNVSDFIQTKIECEECGTHFAVECPKCGSVFDRVWSEEDFSIS